MKSPSFSRTRHVGFNVTSLIDIVFLLVIFFLVSSHVARNDVVEEVELPEAGKVDPDDRDPHRIVVTVTADGTLHVGARTIELPQFEQMLLEAADDRTEPFTVQIRGDRRASFAAVEPLLTACARSGVTGFEFAVLQRQGG